MGTQRSCDFESGSGFQPFESARIALLLSLAQYIPPYGQPRDFDRAS